MSMSEGVAPSSRVAGWWECPCSADAWGRLGIRTWQVWDDRRGRERRVARSGDTSTSRNGRLVLQPGLGTVKEDVDDEKETMKAED
jgi:hypothetical protein